MIPNPFPGFHFVFEGIDGCGKSEQLSLVIAWLQGGLIIPTNRIVLTKEPNKNGFWGKKIYADLKKPVGGLNETDPFGFQTWYAMDSMDNYRDVVLPALKNGRVVISDRSRPSMVYGARSSEDVPKFMAMNLAILGAYFIWPDAIFIFDASIETVLERLREKGGEPDSHEKSTVLTRVRENYLHFAELYPNCHVINAERPPEQVFEDVKKIITAVLESKTKSA